jgi:hypothetical protein
MIDERDIDINQQFPLHLVVVTGRIWLCLADRNRKRRIGGWSYKAGPTKDWKPGLRKLCYGTNLTKLGLLEQDLNLNKEFESGRAGKNQCDSEIEQ